MSAAATQDVAGADPLATDQLATDLAAMCGVWRDRLSAQDPRGRAMTEDALGGVPGAFPYENLVYVDFDGTHYRQTNVVLSGREPHERTFTARVSGGELRFDPLGPEAPLHVGISGGPGLIWFVAASVRDVGLQQYAEPDLIRIEGDRRWRDTVLWRHGELARTLHVEGVRLETDTSVPHPLDPRGAHHPVHGDRSVTTSYAAPAPRAPGGPATVDPAAVGPAAVDPATGNDL